MIGRYKERQIQFLLQLKVLPSLAINGTREGANEQAAYDGSKTMSFTPVVLHRIRPQVLVVL
jgi:hypothetical protein